MAGNMSHGIIIHGGERSREKAEAGTGTALGKRVSISHLSPSCCPCSELLKRLRPRFLCDLLVCSVGCMVPVIAFVFLAALPFTAIASCISSPPGCPLGPGLQSAEIVNNPPTWPYQKFKSSPFTPPQFQITTNGQPLAPGLLFITPSEQTPRVATSDVAPLIMTDAGQLVFNGPIVNATNFRHAVYKDKNILTYWSGISTAGANIGHGYGNVTFLDTSYNEILTVCPKLGLVTPDNTEYPCEADLHESFTTDRDTIIVSAYNATQTDLGSVGGPKDGWIFDCLFFEIEPETGKIIFQWSAIEHVPVTASQQPLAGSGLNKSVPWDYFHINSVVNINDEYLVNSRHTWTTFLLTSKGDIIWRIQGNTGGDFGPLPENGHFVSTLIWQCFLLFDTN